MRKAWISAALAPAIALLAGPLWAQQRTPNTVVACSGTFAKDSSHLKLAMSFDSKNITFTDVEASDGSKVPASVLFPNDPKRRLEGNYGKGFKSEEGVPTSGQTLIASHSAFKAFVIAPAASRYSPRFAAPRSLLSNFVVAQGRSLRTKST